MVLLFFLSRVNYKKIMRNSTGLETEAAPCRREREDSSFFLTLRKGISNCMVVVSPESLGCCPGSLTTTNLLFLRDAVGLCGLNGRHNFKKL